MARRSQNKNRKAKKTNKNIKRSRAQNRWKRAKRSGGSVIPGEDECRTILIDKTNKWKYSACKWLHPGLYKKYGKKHHLDFFRRTLKGDHAITAKKLGETPIPLTKSMTRLENSPIQTRAIRTPPRIVFDDSIDTRTVPYDGNFTEEKREENRERQREDALNRRESRRKRAANYPRRYGLNDAAARWLAAKRLNTVRAPERHEKNWHKTAYGDHVNRVVDVMGRDVIFREGDADWVLSDDDRLTRVNTMRNRYGV